MEKAQRISSLALSLRKKEMIKVRQPLKRIMIPVLDEEIKADIEDVANLIKSEINVKDIEMIDSASGLLVKTVKPNFRELGPRFGKNMGLVNKAISNLTPEDIEKIERKGEIGIQID